MLSDSEILSMYSRAKGRVFDLATMDKQELDILSFIRKVEGYYSMQGGRGLSRQIVSLCIALKEEAQVKTFQVVIEGHDIAMWINSHSKEEVKAFLIENDYNWKSIDEISLQENVDFTL